MKFIPFRILFVSFVVLTIASCKNELKLNAPYKEYPSIYAVLNAADSVHIIRINKVFLGEGDANAMAKVADSINYQPGDLTVTMTRFEYGVQVDAGWHNGKAVKVVEFTDSMVTAGPGAFNTSQRVYVTYDKLFNSGEYKLSVKNNKTGNTFTAKAPSIAPIEENQQNHPLQPPYYPYNPGTAPTTPPYIDYSRPTPTLNVEPILFRPVGGATAMYQLIIRTHYYNDLGGGSRTTDYVDYDFGSKYPKDAVTLGGDKYIRTSFRSNDYFSAVGVGLSRKNLTNNVVGRKVWLIEYIIHSATQDYLDYLEYAKPSLSLNQTKPLYSNFENQSAIGIFTFRATRSVKKEPATTFVNEFSRNSNTCSYRFFDSNDQILGCN